VLAEQGELVEFAAGPTRTVRAHRRVLENLSQRVETALEKMHQQYPRQPLLDRARLASRFAWMHNDDLVEAVLRRMADAGRIRLTGRGVGLAGQGPQLTQKERQLLAQIVEIYRQADFQPPSVEQVKARISGNPDAVAELIELAAAEGRLVRISADFLLHADCQQQMRQTLAQPLADNQGLTVSQIREILNTTRKYAVPICEYLDRVGFTKRCGDVRVLA